MGASVVAGPDYHNPGQHNYANRQVAWFRRAPELYWIEGFGVEAEKCARPLMMVKARSLLRSDIRSTCGRVLRGRQIRDLVSLRHLEERRGGEPDWLRSRCCNLK
jgi:hypothetical protein